ncbi:MAG: chemotaxis protein CheW [Thermodesulfobacteriota bacterium]|nr:chemotaxis protein CheW [Thermodesulfobacteriota bacterium]
MELATQRPGGEAEKRQFCTFWISGRHFGVDILDVKEINSEVHFTPIFHAPEEVKGYVNIRGEIYLILDLALILGFKSEGLSESSRIVLFDAEAGEAFGVVVDSISDIATVDANQIENRRAEDMGPPEEGSERRKLDLGGSVCKLEDELLVIVKSENLLNIVKHLCSRTEVV